MSAILATPSHTLGGKNSGDLAELQRLREDMELLAYIASHDLMAPARIMAHAYETLKDDNASVADRQEAMQMMAEELPHMKALLQGLQDYIRLQSFTVKHAPLDSKELVAAAIEALQEDIRDTHADISYADLPMVHGHRGRLTRLFAALIENAIKFHSPNVAPKIRISAKPSGKEWIFCVEDNGIGIEEEHHGVIFRLFQRLHPSDTYPGYGIGLALAEKTLTSHGGRLWVESQPGQGSRFFFTLPAIT